MYNFRVFQQKYQEGFFFFLVEFDKLNLKSESRTGEAFTLNSPPEAGHINYRTETVWEGNVMGEHTII